MILIVKRILLFVFISSLYMFIRPESHVLADYQEGYDASGNVDVLSEEFINAFLYNFSHYDYADVKRGMTLDEVKQKFNGDLEKVEREDLTDKEAHRVNDIVVVVAENEVESIYVEPQTDVTKEEILERYNAPSGERTSNDLDRGQSALEYKGLPSSNFKVLVVFDADDHVLYITHTLDRDAYVVNSDNVHTFIERGLQLNNLDAENYTFETPTTTVDGSLEIPYTENGTSSGHLTITPNGQLDVHDEDGTITSTVYVPFYGN